MKEKISIKIGYLNALDSAYKANANKIEWSMITEEDGTQRAPKEDEYGYFDYIGNLKLREELEKLIEKA